MTYKLKKVTDLVLEHVERAKDEMSTFGIDALSAEGVLKHPQFQVAALKVAREDLRKAVALIERTKWR
jgi:hypothetical protein